jgi:Subtilase family.
MNNLKIKEVVAKGIIVVVAAGNGGPYLGFVCKTAILINRTINHPADMDEVIAVGGIDDDQETPAWYSSRGMTTLELLYGAGRIKPDLMMLSKNIVNSLLFDFQSR